MANSKQTKAVPVTELRRILLPIVVWGGIMFVVAFGGWWHLHGDAQIHRIAAVLFPDTPRGTRYDYMTALLLTAPPILFAVVAGLVHRSWLVVFGAVLFYVIPLASFYVIVMSFW